MLKNSFFNSSRIAFLFALAFCYTSGIHGGILDWFGSLVKEFNEDWRSYNVDLERQEKDFTRNMQNYEELWKNIGSNLHNLKKDHSIAIPLPVWRKYVLDIYKQESTKKSIHPDTIKKFIAKFSQTVETKEDIVLTASFMEKIKTLHTKDLQTSTETWQSKEKYYNMLQRNLAPAYPWYKQCAHWIGYAGVFAGGLYVGNKIYQKALAHYFTQSKITTRDISQQILLLQAECERKMALLETADSESLTRDLQKTIDDINKTIEKLEYDLEHNLVTLSKPSLLRKTVGIATQVSMMALTTYLFYIVFKKFDDHYLSPEAPLTDSEKIELAAFIASQKSADQQEIFATLGKEQMVLINENLIAEQLGKIVRELASNKNEFLNRLIAHLRSLIEHESTLSEYLAETSKHLEKMNAFENLGVFSPYP